MTPAWFRVLVARERARSARAVAKGKASRSSPRAEGARGRGDASLSARVTEFLNESDAAKRIAGYAGRQAGVVPGVVRGGVRTVQDLGNGFAFVATLPVDPNARAQLGQATKHTLDYVGDRIRNSHKLKRDVAVQLREFDKKVLAEATPMAPTFAGEFKRGIAIGMNRGDFVAENATFPAVAPAVRAGQSASRVAKPLTTADYLALGYSDNIAGYFSLPYKAGPPFCSSE